METPVRQPVLLNTSSANPAETSLRVWTTIPRMTPLDPTTLQSVVEGHATPPSGIAVGDTSVLQLEPFHETMTPLSPTALQSVVVRQDMSCRLFAPFAHDAR